MNVLLEWWKMISDDLIHMTPTEYNKVRDDHEWKCINIAIHGNNTICCFIDWKRYEFFYEI